MTEINFYVSQDKGIKHRLEIAYKLVNLARQRELSIYIYTDKKSTTIALDKLLWQKEKTSFIPHSIIQEADDINHFLKTEVKISHDHTPMADCDYLINLSNKRPDFFSRFIKMAEVIDASEDILTAGRKRYAFYRDRGYTLQYYQL